MVSLWIIGPWHVCNKSKTIFTFLSVSISVLTWIRGFCRKKGWAAATREGPPSVFAAPPHPCKQKDSNTGLLILTKASKYTQCSNTQLQYIYPAYLRYMLYKNGQFNKNASLFSCEKGDKLITNKRLTVCIPKIFDAGIFTQIRPVWVGDLRTGQQNKKNFMIRATVP